MKLPDQVIWVKYWVDMGEPPNSGLISGQAAAAQDDDAPAPAAIAWGAGSSLMMMVSEAEAGKRGPGRPPGAKNRTTEKLREHLLGTYRDPLDGLGEIISMPIPEIAKVLKCTRHKAAEFWLKALAQYAPYVHQRQALALNLDPGGAIPLVVNIGHVQQLGINTSEFGITMTVVQQNQGVSGLTIEQSDADSRTDEAK